MVSCDVSSLFSVHGDVSEITSSIILSSKKKEEENTGMPHNKKVLIFLTIGWNRIWRTMLSLEENL